jgi:Nuclear speckle splicing regulatory protein 1, N-terminal
MASRRRKRGGVFDASAAAAASSSSDPKKPSSQTSRTPQTSSLSLAERKAARVRAAAVADAGGAEIFAYDAHVEEGDKPDAERPVGKSAAGLEVKQKPSQNTAEKAAEKPAPEPRYMQEMMRRAAERKLERDVVYGRQQARAAVAEGGEDDTGEQFVTSAYRAQLKREEAWLEEQRERDAQDAAEERARSSAVGGGAFFHGLHASLLEQGVGAAGRHAVPASAAAAAAVGGTSPEAAQIATDTSGGKESTPSRPPPRSDDLPVNKQDQTTRPAPTPALPSSGSAAASKADAPLQSSAKRKAEQPPEETAEPATTEQQQSSAVDAVADARARFLARKRARQAV